MRVLIINGSPRPKGNVSHILDVMGQEARAKGFEVDYVAANDLKIAPCKGCMVCRSKLECTLPDDDAQRVLALINRCDAVIIGTPCYWGNIPGQLKLLFDRIVYGLIGDPKGGFPKPLHKGKKCILISTSTTPFPLNILFNQSAGAVKALKAILGWSGFKTVKTVQVGGTNKHPVSDKVLDTCRKAVSKL